MAQKNIIIDRRKNDKGKSTPNRQRFLQRARKQVKQSVKRMVREGNIEDITSDKNREVNVPARDLNEPFFHHGEGGKEKRVYPGNDQFQEGDRIPRPQSDSGQGNKGSKDGEGEDDFTFQLTKEEFLDMFFEDLELPDMARTSMATTEEWKMKRAGFSNDGPPNRLNVVRTMKQAKGRRFALRAAKRRRLEELEQEREQLISKLEQGDDDELKKRLDDVDLEIEELRRLLKAVPFIDDVDLRYNNYEKHPEPVTQAVMFCIMDVSGSMGEWEKEMAKRFYMLLYLFLTKHYERVELVFIRHHTTAREVTEEEFFYATDSGGTIVSPALDLMDQIVKERFPTSDWNVYACQCSDGDDWPDDCTEAQKILQSKILPQTQYFAYIEIDRGRPIESDLWPYYNQVAANFQNLSMKRITDASDIYPVFRKLFKKTNAN